MRAVCDAHAGRIAASSPGQTPWDGDGETPRDDDEPEPEAEVPLTPQEERMCRKARRHVTDKVLTL